MVKMYLPAPLLLASAAIVDGATKQFNPIESIFSAFMPQKTNYQRNHTKILDPFAPTAEELEAEAIARRKRQRERNERVKKAFQNMKPEKAEKVSEEELESMDSEYIRKLNWGSGSGGSELSYFVDPGEDYDMWSQAYRMLGGFIDCDNAKAEDDGGDSQEDDEGGRCSRWMMWAAYVDPNYQGNGYDEYYGDEPVGTLDCHRPDTKWKLMGVYRQEFYQFIEQISKHLWAIDEYEYVVALAGLAYMTDYDCFYVGDSEQGEAIYAGVAPKEYGKFEMALYTDDYCLFPNEDLGITYDDFGLTNDVTVDGGSGDNDGGDDESWAENWWQDTEEYTLSQLNDVYDTFRYCTSCIDYPTYQDGYVIGDDGMSDDDLINQCWKFYSHDSFTCESDCIAKGHAQGTILSIDVGGKFYGSVIEEFWDEANLQMGENSQQVETQLSRLLANVFVTFSFVVFVATFLAFAVARRSRYRESRSSKARRLLGSSRKRSSSRKRRSKSRDRGGSDGVMRGSKTSSRRKTSRSRSKNRGDRDYEPPQSED